MSITKETRDFVLSEISLKLIQGNKAQAERILEQFEMMVIKEECNKLESRIFSIGDYHFVRRFKG